MSQKKVICPRYQIQLKMHFFYQQTMRSLSSFFLYRKKVLFNIIVVLIPVGGAFGAVTLSPCCCTA